MKKFSTLLLSLALGSTLAAQTPKFTPDRGALLDGKTIVKANITSPIFKNYSFAAERILTKGLSLQLGIATMPKGALPFSSSFENHIGHDVSMRTISSLATRSIWTYAKVRLLQKSQSPLLSTSRATSRRIASASVSVLSGSSVAIRTSSSTGTSSAYTLVRVS